VELLFRLLALLAQLVVLAVVGGVLVGTWKLFGVGKPRPPLRRAAVVAAWGATVLVVLGVGFLALWSWASGS
jgi:hypothetical protein